MNYPVHTIPMSAWSFKYTINKKESSMNYTKAILIVDDNVKVVKVNYETGSTDRYFKTIDDTIVKDDLVIIPTSTRHNFTVGKVIETGCSINLDDNEQIFWIAGKVD